MPPQLKHDGIQALLQQTERYHARHKTINYCRRYGNVLFVNRLFVSLAKNIPKVFQFNVRQYSSNTFGVWVGNCSGDCAKTSMVPFERICRLLNVLKPSLVVFHYDTRAVFQSNKILDLIPHVDGKIRLVVDRTGLDTRILYHFWDKIDEFICNGHAMTQINRVKQFNKLSVCKIDRIDYVNAALRQSSKQLELHFEGVCSRADVNDADQFVSKLTTACSLSFVDMLSFGQVLAVVRKILIARSRLKSLNIDYSYSSEHLTSADQFVKYSAQQHASYIQLIKTLREMSPNLEVNLNFCTYLCGYGINQKGNLQQALKAIDGFEGIQSDFSFSSKFISVDTSKSLNATFGLTFGLRK